MLQGAWTLQNIEIGSICTLLLFAKKYFFNADWQECFAEVRHMHKEHGVYEA
jgi:hypothetical protein